MNLKKYQTPLIIGLVGFFTLFALMLRLIPFFSMGNTDILSMAGSDDPMYCLRQVEVLLANHYTYAWFDPMNLIPAGHINYWGPLYAFMGAFACLLTGATTRPEIIASCLAIPCLVAAAAVAVMYFAGRAYGDWRTGLLASGFMAVVSGQFFAYSVYGYYDHEVCETLLSAFFCVCFIHVLNEAQKSQVNLADFSTYKQLVPAAVLAGFAYALGLSLMPTLILFALIVAVYTAVQCVVDSHRKRSSEYLLVINTIVFAIAITGLLVIGIQDTTLNMGTYSIGQILAYIAIIAATAFIVTLQRALKGKEWYLYPAVLAGCAVGASIVMAILFPSVFNVIIGGLYQFFGTLPITNTVEEARGWTLPLAWQTFNYGLILMIGGIAAILYTNIKREHPNQVFILIWSVIILYSTWQHVRYEYYLAANIALLSAICTWFVYERGWGDLKKLVSGHHEPEHEEKGHRKKHRKAVQKHHVNVPVIALILVVTLIAVLFAYTSLTLNYYTAAEYPQMNPDWKESLTWMANNTPDPGVGYYTIYTQKTFQFPAQAYGVMSWWDYGHLITYIAKRIPNANPFQEGVSGPNGSASFFVSTSEGTADAVLDNDRTRYVVTDIEMDTGKFWAMATWYNQSLGGAPYQEGFLAPDPNNPASYQSLLLNSQQYYLTMVSRLHNFDGSMTDPSQVYYIEYEDPAVAHASLPVITNVIPTNASDAGQRAARFNANPPSSGVHAAAVSSSVVAPIDTVPALQHFRLVHESPTTVTSSGDTEVKYVKIFEYVKGAVIKGDGIIEVPVVTNTGRNFTYRQQSVNGVFIVPYATSGSALDVRATGNYVINGTTQEFVVPEAAVEQGLTIS